MLVLTLILAGYPVLLNSQVPLAIKLSNNLVALTFQAEPNLRYELQRSSNLLNWVAGTATNPALPGSVQLVESFQQPAGPTRPTFYRLATTPQPTNTAIGFATVNGNTVGGQAGPTVTVSDLAGLNSALAGSGARIVRVQGTINLGGSVTPGANKTIVGVGTNATLIGNLLIQNVTNVIVQNLRLSNAAGLGGADGLTVENSRHVWIDHCSFSDCKDGQLDVTHGSDFVTVSWCKFSYTTNSGHNFSSLVGHSDNNAGEDAGKLHVTYHHNWWSTLCIERMPRTRFGRIHVFNNYFHSPGNNYCVRASIESEVLIENNFFENVSTPYEKFAPQGRIRAVGNDTTTATGVQSFNDDVFAPPYAYTLQTPAAAKAAVISGAGGF